MYLRGIDDSRGCYLSQMPSIHDVDEHTNLQEKHSIHTKITLLFANLHVEVQKADRGFVQMPYLETSQSCILGPLLAIRRVCTILA
jgi:hypothetical protein